MIKNILAFAAGGLLGGGIVYLVLNSKFEKRYEEDLKESKEKFEASIKELKEAIKQAEEVTSENENRKGIRARKELRNPAEQRRFVREKTNYDQLHNATEVPDLGGTGVERGSRFLDDKRKAEDSRSEIEGAGRREGRKYEVGEIGELEGEPGGPTDEDPATDPEERWDQEEEEAKRLYEEGKRESQERAANRGKPPKIISEADFWNKYPQYDAQTLMYYTEDDVLATEEDEEIFDVGMTVGDALERYGFMDNDESEIFVVNHRIGCRFQIQKVWGSYADIKRM
jgi:hypothetical protein